MGRKANTWCRICGAEYFHCYDCDKLHSWRAICDSPIHYQIFCAIHDYQVSQDAQEARVALAHLGVDENAAEEFLPAVRDTVLEILGGTRASLS